MDMEPKPDVQNEILQLLKKQVMRDELSHQEQQLLETWLRASPHNQLAWEEMQHEAWLGQNLQQYSRANATSIWNKTLAHRGVEQKLKSVHRVHFLRRNWWAAAVLLLIAGGAYFLLQPGKPDSVLAVKQQQEIQPGKEGAILTLADGRKLLLDSMGNGIVTSQNGTQVVLKDGQLSYEAGLNGKPVINTMTTPRGRQFRLNLPDGTTVWLNAASSLTYPTAFTGNERAVEITGEAYFEVAKNEKMPFRVHINKATTVEVLGTHFNVSGYADENSINTTLLEGSVRLKTADQTLILKPGQAGHAGATGQFLHLAGSVDTSAVMAWKNGLFNFEGMKFDAVMRQLARWYDIDVEYEKGVPNIEFGGKMDRALTLSNVLSGLQASKVHFRMEGRRLIVQP